MRRLSYFVAFLPYDVTTSGWIASRGSANQGLIKSQSFVVNSFYFNIVQ